MNINMYIYIYIYIENKMPVAPSGGGPGDTLGVGSAVERT